MTKKDFELIARTLRDCMPAISGSARCLAQEETWREVVNEMARALHSTNLRFDRVRFLKACGA